MNVLQNEAIEYLHTNCTQKGSCMQILSFFQQIDLFQQSY